MPVVEPVRPVLLEPTTELGERDHARRRRERRPQVGEERGQRGRELGDLVVHPARGRVEALVGQARVHVPVVVVERGRLQPDVALDQAGDVAQRLGQVAVLVVHRTVRGYVVDGLAEGADGGQCAERRGDRRLDRHRRAGVHGPQGCVPRRQPRVVRAGQAEVVDAVHAEHRSGTLEGRRHGRAADLARLERRTRPPRAEHPVQPAGTQRRTGRRLLELLGRLEVRPGRVHLADRVHDAERSGRPHRHQRRHRRVQAEPVVVAVARVAQGQHLAFGHPDVGAQRLEVDVVPRHHDGQPVEATPERQHDHHVAGVRRRRGEGELGGELTTGQAGRCGHDGRALEEGPAVESGAALAGAAAGLPTTASCWNAGDP